MSTWAIVVAAGSGTRFGGAKQFASVAGRRVVDWSIDAARPAVDGIVVVVAPTQLDAGPSLDADAVVAGGATRSESVRCGLAVVPDDAEIVVVHDGARPAASVSLFRSVIDAVRDGADGAVPGIEVTDTLRSLSGGTVDRRGLVAVQTPQAFRADALRAAHAPGVEATDDAAVVEDAGGKITVVPGDPRNLKLTHPDDLAVLERALAADGPPGPGPGRGRGRGAGRP